MPNNSFIGQIAFLDGATAPGWLVYDPDKSVWLGKIKGTTPVGLVDIFTHQSDFDFADTSGGEHTDRYGNTVVDTKNTTGKVTITVDAGVYGALVAERQGKPVNIVLLSRDIDQGVYIHQVIPTFNKKTTAGKMQIAEMSFKFIQPANIPNPTDRHRLFEIVSSGANPN